MEINKSLNDTVNFSLSTSIQINKFCFPPFQNLKMFIMQTFIYKFAMWAIRFYLLKQNQLLNWIFLKINRKSHFIHPELATNLIKFRY